ncbi:unnamed protein product, partial [Polarella glacialis]
MGLNLQIRRVVFRTLRKFDGEVTRRLTPPEIRQISGRAGRFGGRYGELGLVACFTAEDCAVVREALAEDMTKSEAKVQVGAFPRAALLPLPEQLEAFSHALEADLGKLLPFAALVERFMSIAEVSPLYFLAQSRSLVEVARALADVRLPPGEKFTFCQAPISSTDLVAFTALHGFARDYAASGFVGFPRVRLAEPCSESGVTARHVLELEGLHKVCEAYLWLASRFPTAFLDGDAAQEARQEVAARIAESLRRPL